jgi:Protein of unknown function (DUF1638)
MSSSPIARTSTTGSSSSCSSPAEPARPALAVIACGALGGHIRDIAAKRGWDIEIRTLPSILHNSPRQIAPLAEQLVIELQRQGRIVALAYADCGTYGALDELCERRGLRRLPGLHCYDVFAGPERIEATLAREPGTYLLTDFLVRSFRFSVIEPLGLDRHPELWPDYFGHYRRIVWLAQEREPALAAEAERIAGLFGLPLSIIDTGNERLERGVRELLADDADRRAPAAASATASLR